MAKNLVIVESPAKAKTIEKFLGKKNYTVKASVGHIRDLPKSKLGVDVEQNFEPQYITIRGKGDIVKDLKKEAKKADFVYLATDQDREGEAISWHLAYLLGLDINDNNRITFNEITKDAIKKAIKSPRKIDLDLVDAQQARRIIDRLVGYKISPILWIKVRKGLSAGRVQSVSTRLIVEREEEIRAFTPEEYWTIDATVTGEDKRKAVFKLTEKNNKKIELHSEEETKLVLKDLHKKDMLIDKIDSKEKKRSAPKPFTTSLLQQEAGNKISFSSKRTMSAAQQLYEGVTVKGEGTVGLITYIRTDSQRISEEALASSKKYIEETFGKNYYQKYSSPKKKNSSIQDAHECIRPTSIYRTPESVKDSLTTDQYKLYKLIWERFVAASMSSAIFHTDTVLGSIDDYQFKVSGSTLVFDGFLKVYSYSKAEEQEIPNFVEKQYYKVNKLTDKQHFTQPPARYTEATLIKTLEELGIGRPSTYSPTISTILQREYVKKEKNFLIPTELGEIVTSIMKENFKNIVDVNFTADMEKQLDSVEEGTLPWKSVVEKIYTPLIEDVTVAEENLEKVLLQEKTDEKCPVCNEEMVVKYGRFGKFLACKNYPECTGTKPYLEKIGMPCPDCEDGEVIIRRSKKGRIFYGCSNFPNCSFVSWNRPTGKKCPECQENLVEKVTKKGTQIVCSSKTCSYKEEVKQ